MNEELQALEALWNTKVDEQLRLDRRLREISEEIDDIASRIAAMKEAEAA